MDSIWVVMRLIFAKDIAKALAGEAIVNVLPRLQAEIITTSGNKIKSDPATKRFILANHISINPLSIVCNDLQIQKNLQ